MNVRAWFGLYRNILACSGKEEKLLVGFQGFADRRLKLQHAAL